MTPKAPRLRQPGAPCGKLVDTLVSRVIRADFGPKRPPQRILGSISLDASLTVPAVWEAGRSRMARYANPERDVPGRRDALPQARNSARPVHSHQQTPCDLRIGRAFGGRDNSR